jgi:hypothetical protein
MTDSASSAFTGQPACLHPNLVDRLLALDE